MRLYCVIVSDISLQLKNISCATIAKVFLNKGVNYIQDNEKTNFNKNIFYKHQFNWELKTRKSNNENSHYGVHNIIFATNRLEKLVALICLIESTAKKNLLSNNFFLT